MHFYCFGNVLLGLESWDPNPKYFLTSGFPGACSQFLKRGGGGGGGKQLAREDHKIYLIMPWNQSVKFINSVSLHDFEKVFFAKQFKVISYINA